MPISARQISEGVGDFPNFTSITGTSTATFSRFISTIATGTAPLSITSTTVVPNLNADLLDGNHASAFATAGQTMYIGTTAVTINRASAALQLTGVDISGKAGGLQVPDTRAVNDQPQGKIGYSLTLDFKNNTAVSSPPTTASATYSHIMTVAGWDTNGGSGGWPTQLSFGDGIAVRQATSATVWGSWKNILHQGNFNSYALPLSGGTVTGRVELRATGNSTSYVDSDFELYTSDNTPPGISFHRAGYSATFLYENDGELLVNAWTTRAQTGKLISSGNFNSYAPTLTGTGAWGTWSIHITGNAATVTTNANLTGEVTSVGNATTVTNAAVIGKVLTGLNNAAGTVAATDTILQAFNKINGNIALKANIASPVFTGNVTGLGVATGTQFNGITGIASVAPLIAGTATVGTSTLAARQDHVHPVQVNITGSAALLNQKQSDKFEQRVVYNTTAQNTGYYKINILPVAGWMLQFTIRVYQTYQYYDIRISGYNYGTNYWYSPKASLIDSDVDSFNVVFGYDGTNNLWVAIPAGYYTGLSICNIVNGYLQAGQDWSDNFSISNVASLTGTTQTTVTVYRPIKYNEGITTSNYTSYSPTLAGTGASGTWGISITGNANTATASTVLSNSTAGGFGIAPGAGDGATSTTTNLKISQWYGVGFAPSIQGQPVPIDENAVWIDVRTGNLTARNIITAKEFRDYDNSGYIWNPNTNSAHRFSTPTGYVDIGSMNSSYCHFSTDRAQFYFNKNVVVDGTITRYQDSALYLHSNNYNSYAPTLTGTGASGTWGISITGNASTATRLTNLTSTTSTTAGTDNAESCISYIASISLLGQTDGALYSHVYSSSWKHNIYGDYRTGQIAVRGKNNGTWQAWRTVLDQSNYNSYQPTLAGVGATGTWSISIEGSAPIVYSRDGDRDANTKLPTSQAQAVRYDFVSAQSVGTGGNYVGLMTYSPWTGTTASTGDASYQLAFGSSATNGGGIPQLRLRKGIDSTWNSWCDILTSVNVKTVNGNSILGSGDITISAQGGASPDLMQVIATSTTAVVYTTYVCTASLTLTLPASPTVGVWVAIVNRSSTSTITVARNSQPIMGLAENMTINIPTNGAGFKLVYSGATHGWVIL